MNSAAAANLQLGMGHPLVRGRMTISICNSCSPLTSVHRHGEPSCLLAQAKTVQVQLWPLSHLKLLQLLVSKGNYEISTIYQMAGTEQMLHVLLYFQRLSIIQTCLAQLWHSRVG